MMLCDFLETPLGRFAVVTDEAGRLLQAGFAEEHARMERALATGSAVAAKDPGGASTALRRYFAGERTAFDELEVAPEGTPFQREVWAALREIPWGETRSYADIARRIGRPNAVRAVGLANGQNPIALVLPCHRVIGSDGSLTGYGGGLHRKRWLLVHEGVALQLELTP